MACEGHEWKKVEEISKKNPHLVLSNDFFTGLTKSMSLKAIRKMFLSFEEQRRIYFDEKIQMESSQKSQKSTLERQQATLQRYMKKKEDILQELLKIEKEIKEAQMSIKIKQEIYEIEKENVKYLESICEILEESFRENQKARDMVLKNMEEWMSLNKNKEIKHLSSEDVSFLLASMDIDYDTKQKPTGSNLSEISGHYPLKDFIKMESLGDRKRVLDMISKKTIHSIKLLPVPVVSQEGSPDTEKILEWTYQDVYKWISNKEIENLNALKENLKHQKIDGKQLLFLSDEEIEKDIRLNEESKRELKKAIEELKKENPIDVNKILDIPEDLKCPITEKLMEDPVMASDGWTYERKSIEEYFKQNKHSPMTGEPFDDDILRSNKSAKKKIQSFLLSKNEINTF